MEEPYQLWKTETLASGLKDDFNNIISDVKRLPLHDAIESLGYFILNHPHEDGNAEFVFGDYRAQDLGRIFYEDTIAQISAIDEILNQLQIVQI